MGVRGMSTTTPEPPGFAEFLSLVRALPPDQRASFAQMIANVQAGMPVQDALREYATLRDIKPT